MPPGIDQFAPLGGAGRKVWCMPVEENHWEVRGRATYLVTDQVVACQGHSIQEGEGWLLQEDDPGRCGRCIQRALLPVACAHGRCLHLRRA